MLKYCNACKRNLVIDRFNSHKQNACKNCMGKKALCDLRGNDFKGIKLTKHKKKT